MIQTFKAHSCLGKSAQAVVNKFCQENPQIKIISIQEIENNNTNSSGNDLLVVYDDLKIQQEIKVITENDAAKFENVVNHFLKQGYIISNTSCCVINSERHNFIDYYQAILIKQ